MKLLPLIALMIAARLSSGQNTIILNAELGKDKISKHIYGHFSEHLGHCIYGGFYVGGQYPNLATTEGVRNDIIEALKKLKIPNLRWPGGCFADTYHWKDGIGPKEKRPSMVNKWWGGVTEDNSFGTHDFLNLCERIGAEPYIAGNVGSGTVQELADWVQYVNFSESSPMSKLRVQNGRDKPWKVRFWGVGNEVWGCGGNMTPEFYANVYRQYATFMSGWSNSEGLFRIASGANSADYHWTEVLMRDIPHELLEGVALHHYSVIDWNNKGSATEFSEGQYFTTIKRALLMEELITRHTAIMDKYDPQKKIALVVDEWGGWYNTEPGTNGSFLFQQNTMRDAILAGVTLNIFNRHADRVRMANLAQTVNVLQAVILTNEEKMILTPTYHVMEMFNIHQEAISLPLEINCNKYESGKESCPAISGSASRDTQGVIHISLVNIDAMHAQPVSIEIRGAKFNSVTGRILTSSKLQDFNSFDKPDLVKPESFKEANIDQGSVKAKLPPFSVVVLELKQ